MQIPPKYELTKEILDLTFQAEVKKALFENIPVSPSLINDLQRRNLLRSSLFSAKIEGNRLNENDLDRLTRLDKDLKDRLEIENIITAFNFVRNNPGKTINKVFLLDLHKIVMKSLTPDLGKLRKEPSAVFNQSGFPVYIPPPPSEIESLIDSLINFINSNDEKNILIKAAISHIVFEKIHPFLDGNGRVGRILYNTILAKGNYHFNWLLSLEEIINERKEEYYVYLDKNDATSFIEFSLEILIISAQKVLDRLNEQKTGDEERLLPRRKEILDIIKDHGIISLDSIKRRFLKVPARTLRYDLKKLEEKGFIIKIGSTRGAMYKRVIK